MRKIVFNCKNKKKEESGRMAKKRGENVDFFEKGKREANWMRVLSDNCHVSLLPFRAFFPLLSRYTIGNFISTLLLLIFAFFGAFSSIYLYLALNFLGGKNLNFPFSWTYIYICSAWAKILENIIIGGFKFDLKEGQWPLVDFSHVLLGFLVFRRGLSTLFTTSSSENT